MKRNGFTLIELVISISIIVILSGMSIAAFTSFNERQKIMDDSQSLLTELKRTYTKAISGVYPSGCVGLQRLEITLPSATDAHGMSVQTICSNMTDSSEVKNVIKTSTFKQSYVFAWGVPKGELIGISPALSNGSLTVTIVSDVQSSLIKDIVLSSFGVVSLR